MSQENQAIVRRFFEALWNSGNPDAIDDLMDGACNADFRYPNRLSLAPTAHEAFKSFDGGTIDAGREDMLKIHPRIIEILLKESGDFRGVIKRSALQIREVAPDIRCAIEEMVAEKNMVWTRWTLRSAQKAASGQVVFFFSRRKPVAISGVTICRIDEAKIQDYRSYISFKNSRARFGWWAF